MSTKKDQLRSFNYNYLKTAIIAKTTVIPVVITEAPIVDSTIKVKFNSEPS